MTAPLVLLPGMMCDARLFGPQITASGRDRAIHIPPIGTADTIEGIASAILESAPPRFALAGLSLGGIVAMEMMRQAADRVTHLALLDTNPKAETSEVAARREPQIAGVLRGDLTAVMRDEMKPHYLADGPHREDVLALVLEMALSQGPDVFVRQSRALQTRPDQQETLKAVHCPALVLCGEDDRLCPLSRHELMRDLLPNSELVVIEGAGHLPTLEQPDLTSQALLDWLDR